MAEILRDRKLPGETTRRPSAGVGDNGEPSPEVRSKQNTASPFYGKRVKNDADGEGSVIFVSTDEINKITVKFDSGEVKKFLDKSGYPDPLEVIAQKPKKQRNERKMAAAVGASVPVMV